MRPDQKQSQTDSKISELLAQGGVITEYKSIWELLTGNTTFKYFSGQETANVLPLAKYNKTGKNPSESKEAVIVAFGFEATDANEAQIDLSAPSQSYAKHSSLTKLLNQSFFTIKQNKKILREGFVSKIHQPVPRILKPIVNGTAPSNTVTPVASADIAGVNIENKNEKHALYLPINLRADGEVLDIQVFLPSGGFSVDSNLNGSLLILHALAVEFPDGRKK